MGGRIVPAGARAPSALEASRAIAPPCHGPAPAQRPHPGPELLDPGRARLAAPGLPPRPGSSPAPGGSSPRGASPAPRASRPSCIPRCGLPLRDQGVLYQLIYSRETDMQTNVALRPRHDDLRHDVTRSRGGEAGCSLYQPCYTVDACFNVQEQTDQPDDIFQWWDAELKRGFLNSASAPEVIPSLSGLSISNNTCSLSHPRTWFSVEP